MQLNMLVAETSHFAQLALCSGSITTALDNTSVLSQIKFLFQFAFIQRIYYSPKIIDVVAKLTRGRDHYFELILRQQSM